MKSIAQPQPLELTKTQRKIVPLLFQGYTSQQIADRLTAQNESREEPISVKTISSHLNTAYRRNGLNNRHQLVLRWLQESYAFVPVVQSPDALDGRFIHLLSTERGVVSAKKRGNVWRDAITNVVIPNGDIQAVCMMSRYEPEIEVGEAS